MRTICADAPAALHDGETINGETDHLGALIGESLLLNSQGEGFLFAVVADCLERGLLLRDAAVKCKDPAAKITESIGRDAQSPFVTQIFRANPDGTLGLNEFGVQYLLELIDPEYSHHRRRSDYSRADRTSTTAAMVRQNSSCLEHTKVLPVLGRFGSSFFERTSDSFPKAPINRG